jgi:antitoxin component YwqK of YwqJK toxin-antitoxin module
MSTDSGNEDSGESNQQSEKTPKGKGFLGILVFLIAVGGVVLIVMSGQDPSIPQLESWGGDQNPLVGIPNAVIGGLGFLESLMYLVAGGILLVIALVVYIILRKSPRPLRTVALISAFVFVVFCGVAINSTISDNKRDEERARRTAEKVENQKRFSGRYETFEDQLLKYHEPHPPGPFNEYYKRGNKGVEGNYDLNGKMDGQWTRWQSGGELQWTGTLVDGLFEGTLSTYEWVPWLSKGTKKERDDVYRLGAIQQTTTYDFHGKKESEVDYRIGIKRHATGYWNTGDERKKQEVTYTDQGMVGPETRWYRNGQTAYQSIFVDGEKVSETCWYDSGEIKSQTTYDLDGEIENKKKLHLSGVELKSYGREFECPFNSVDYPLLEDIHRLEILSGVATGTTLSTPGK